MAFTAPSFMKFITIQYIVVNVSGAEFDPSGTKSIKYRAKFHLPV